MKTTKKLLILSLIAVMAMVAVMPSTFSWYAHDGETNYQGNAMEYERESLPLSLQQSGGVTMSTILADKYGKKTSTTLPSGGGSIDAGKTQRYITTLTNNGSNPVSVDLDMSKITNNAKVYVGTADPVVNEKSYASRAVLEKVDWDYEVIYFEPRRHYEWWGEGSNYSAPNTPYGQSQTTPVINYSSKTITGNNDLNLEYQIGQTIKPIGLQECPNRDPASGGNYKVYRAFVTTEADSLFFFNHYYVIEDTNKEWNRTPTVTDFAEGRVYYLNGKSNDYNNKDISYHDSYNDTNICVYSYYKTATMAAGKTASIALDKGTKDMIGTGDSYDYLGKNISYSVKSGSQSPADGSGTVCTVSKDGLITALEGGTAVINTTITGEFGDTVTLETTVNVPAEIDQVPVVHNIEVPAGESVDVTWFVHNDSAAAASFKNVFINV